MPSRIAPVLVVLSIHDRVGVSRLKYRHSLISRSTTTHIGVKFAIAPEIHSEVATNKHVATCECACEGETNVLSLVEWMTTKTEYLRYVIYVIQQCTHERILLSVVRSQRERGHQSQILYE